MQLQGIRIEHFINGGVSLIWIIPIIEFLHPSFSIQNLHPSYVLMLLPLFYALGMLINYLAMITTKSLKKRVQQEIFHKYYGEKRVSQLYVLALIAHFSKDLLSGIEIRLTRKRISRGVFFSLYLSLATTPLLLAIQSDFIPILYLFPLNLILVYVFYKMLKRDEAAYCEHQAILIKMIRELDKERVNLKLLFLD